MPNWVKHTVQIRGEAAALQAFKEAVRVEPQGEERGSDFSFGRVIPMPPELNIESSSDGDMGMAALTGEGASSFYHYARDAQVSTPEQLLEYLKANRPLALKIGQRYIDNLAKHGVKTWYDWCVKAWGTKWDACDVNMTDKEDGSIELYFETAWSFPEPVMHKLAQLFPELEFDGTVDEEGGWFYGEFKLADGALSMDFKKGVRAGGPYDYSDEEDDEGGEDGDSNAEAEAAPGDAPAEGGEGTAAK